MQAMAQESSSAAVAMDAESTAGGGGTGGGGGSGVLEQFVQLASSASSGESLILILQQALAHPSVFVFGELLELQNVQKLRGTEFQVWLDTLQLFATGTYPRYREHRSSFPELNPGPLKKLKMLTIADRAAKQATLPYTLLLEQLEVESIRELEDLIIDAMYAGLVNGKLDQAKREFRIQSAMGRDMGPGDVERMVDQLSSWIDASESLLGQLAESVGASRAGHEAANTAEISVRIEQVNLDAALAL